MNPNLEAALLRCMDPDYSRPYLAEIINGVVDDRAVCIATNAKVMLVVDYQDELDAAWAQTQIGRALLPIIDKHSRPPALWASRESLIAWAGQDYRRPCPECDGGLKEAKTCTECGGSGWVECNYQHEHECPECDDDGRIGTKCAACNGSGILRNDPAPIRIPAMPITINAHLIGGLIDLLPGDRIGIVPGPVPVLANTGSVAFRGPSWLLIVAGLQWNGATLRDLLTGEQP